MSASDNPIEGDTLGQVTLLKADAIIIGKTAENLIAVADQRLYQAKRSGRNRVIGSG